MSDSNQPVARRHRRSRWVLLRIIAQRVHSAEKSAGVRGSEDVKSLEILTHPPPELALTDSQWGFRRDWRAVLSDVPMRSNPGQEHCWAIIPDHYPLYVVVSLARTNAVTAARIAGGWRAEE